MSLKINPGDCVQIADGRVARVRENIAHGFSRIRVRKNTSNSHQFLEIRNSELKKIDCPKGWMSPEGFNRYIKVTLRKMKERMRKDKRKIKY
jgi:hypothetical protein